jgi:hypothetical protein
MKTFKLISALLAILMFSECKQGSFTTRKYTKGHYREDRDKVATTKSTDRQNHKKEAAPKIESFKDLAVKESAVDKKADEKPIAQNSTSEKKTIHKKSASTWKAEQKALFKKQFKALKLEKSQKRSSSPDTGPLVAAILGVAGIVIDYMGLVLAIAAGEYALLLLMVVGLACGIVAIIMGAKGLKDFNRERRQGNKNVANMVLSIVGLATGGASIILAIYFAIYGALWITVSTGI